MQRTENDNKHNKTQLKQNKSQWLQNNQQPNKQPTALGDIASLIISYSDDIYLEFFIKLPKWRQLDDNQKATKQKCNSNMSNMISN